MTETKRKKTIRRVLHSLLAIAMIFLVVGNYLCMTYSTVITQFFSKPDVSEREVVAATAKSRDAARKVAEEGYVLLENREGALPLDTAKPEEVHINLIGWRSTDLVYTLSGSGGGNRESVVTLYEGLKNAGFEPNDELYSFYESTGIKDQSLDAYGLFHSDYSKKQVELATYPDGIWERAKDYSDVAVVVISRTGGEGGDLPRSMADKGGAADEHYLELGAEEKELFEKVESMNFGKVIVLLNTGHPMELGFLDDYGIDAALWIGYGGTEGMNALGDILSGEVNPSGRLADTYVYDNTTSPAYMNALVKYTNVNGKPNSRYHPPQYPDGGPVAFINYSEGIYVGYRYYETRWINNETMECDEAAYRSVVRYPFGYGLSYTDFEQKIVDYNDQDGTITMSVEVKNVGDQEGKDVVQIYYTAPYTVGGIEKSHVVLADFGKTELLQPGESETVTISFAEEEMASFDYTGSGAYVLEEGNYEIKLMRNAHEVIDSRTHAVDSTVIYDEDNKRDSDGEAAVTRLTAAQGDQVFLSRADWEGTFPQASVEEMEASEEIKAAFDKALAGVPDRGPSDDDRPLVTDVIKSKDEKKDAITLQEMVGLDYNDEKWEQFVNQLSIEEMTELIGNGCYQTSAVESVGKPASIELDGPGGIRAITQEGKYQTVCYPAGIVMASTWNQKLIEEMGDAFGKEAVAWKISAIYAPAMNIRRSPFGGRNAEYYSEDGVLSGKIAAAEVRGIQSNRVYAYIKHFVCYEEIGHAPDTAVWANEQALREIFLRPFEECVKNADAHGVMTSMFMLGTEWDGASKELCTDILRNEWGFQGIVITDAYTGFANINAGLPAGTDLALASPPHNPDNTGAEAVANMRRACHNIMYTVANSVAMDFNDQGPKDTWKIGLYALDAAMIAVCGVVVYKAVRRKHLVDAEK